MSIVAENSGFIVKEGKIELENGESEIYRVTIGKTDINITDIGEKQFYISSTFESKIYQGIPNYTQNIQTPNCKNQ